MKGNIDKIDFEIKEVLHTENGCSYKIKIKVPDNLGFIDDVNLVVESSRRTDYMPLQFVSHNHQDHFVYFESDIFLPTKALYHYYFTFTANKEKKYFKKGGEEKNPNILTGEKWKLSVNFDVPEWAKGKIMYHVFVDRFNRGSKDAPSPMPRRDVYASFDDEMIVGPNKDGIWNADFYGGDLKGIEEKLDYIKSLGVSIIYLSPVVWSQSNHRYDTSDYETVDPYVGVNDDLKNLCTAAHKKGMKVVLDAVFNHTGNDSKYFNEFNTFKEVGAYQSKDSKYYPFYKKYYDGNNTYFSYWWGMKNLPVCDGNSLEWQQYIYGKNGVIDKWFELGIDGLRLDVADELTDEFIEGIRTAVKRNKKDGFIIGEVWKNPMRMNRGYIESGKGMDSVMNYVLVDALIRYVKYGDFYKLREVINQLKYEYPDEVLKVLMNFTSTHDISRAINIFGTDEFAYGAEWAWDVKNDDRNFQKHYELSKEQYRKGKDLYELYTFTLTFFPGILSIFYGDELGLTGLGNLANRKPFPKDDKKDNPKNIDLELLNFFRWVGNIRQKEKFLEEAGLEVVELNDKVFIFQREKEEEQALIAVNRTSDDQKLLVPKSFERIEPVYTLKKSRKNELSPFGGVAIKRKV